MADSKINWQDIHRQIYLGLDILAEFEALGVRVASRVPNAKGFVDAHAINCEDRTPSASICVQDSPPLGRYTDFRDPARSCFLLEFAVRCGKGTFTEVLKHYAGRANVKLPSAEYEWTGSRLDFRDPPDPSFFELQMYSEGKPGVTVRALKEVGVRAASLPKTLPPEMRNHVFAFPMYGSSMLLGLDPTGFHCVASNPARRIRRYRGKGQPDDLIKTQTFDTYGLMNVEGLKHLGEATVVNIVEGITDLLVGQAVLGPWRDEAPAERQHVILSAGGCSYHCKPEWLPHFAGKEIRLWFDVCDQKNEGQNAAAVWVAQLLAVAKAVRNVTLPLGPEGGKNDLRAWLTEPGATRGYAEMYQYAQTFDPIDPGDAEAAEATPHSALLKGLGLVVIGEHEGTEHIEVYSEEHRKGHTIRDVDKLTIAKLIQLVGVELVEEHVHEGKDPQPPRVQLKDVKNAIAAAAGTRLFRGIDRLGGGTWEIDGDIVLVKSQEVGVLRGTKIERINSSFYKERFLDLSQSSENWTDFNVLERYLVEAQRDDWCREVFQETTKLFAKWFWKQQPAPKVITSLVIASWLQTIWTWRPEVFITCDSDTGKSLLIESTLPAIWGSLCWHSHKVTEAAIRQTLKHHAKIPLQDEFEHSPNRQAVLELWRVTSRRGKVTRGTADQKGMEFYIRHLPWFAAIEMGLRKQADKNRFIILDMLEIPAEIRGNVDLPSSTRLHELGQNLLGVGLRHIGRAKELANQLKIGQVTGVPGRVLESFSVPCAIASAIEGLTLPEARQLITFWLSHWDFTGQAVKDKFSVLEKIL